MKRGKTVFTKELPKNMYYVRLAWYPKNPSMFWQEIDIEFMALYAVLLYHK